MTIHCDIARTPVGFLPRFSSRVAILIPAYNEAAHLERLIHRCWVTAPALILVVDDGSQDDTPAVLFRLAARTTPAALAAPLYFLRNEKNLGKQGAVRRGLAWLSSLALDGVAIIDGDGQHDPTELPALARLLERYHLVIGARSRAEMPWTRRLSNRLVNLGFKLIGGVDFGDVQSGLRIFRKPLADALAARLPARGGYALEHESLAVLAAWSRDTGQTVHALAVPVSCRYGEAKSGIGLRSTVRLAGQTVRQAVRIRRIARPRSLAMGAMPAVPTFAGTGGH